MPAAEADPRRPDPQRPDPQRPVGQTLSGADSDSFLGVERSLGDRRWVARPGDGRVAVALSQRLGAPEMIGRVMAARGVGLEEAESFLNPTLSALLPDPGHLKGMAEGAERIAGAVMQNERIAIFGDYDVDGATSSALLTRFFAAAGGRSQVYIPDRLKEGYGPNEKALLSLRQSGVSVVVTVDCGTSAFEPLAAAARAGLEVVVVDHHAAEARLPQAVSVINPNRLDEGSPHGQLAAVGVTFLLAVAINRALRQAGWYKQRPEPDLRRWLDLVALGTVCDVVPLTGVNRALVTQGLKVMGHRTNTGLRALADVAGITEAPGTYHAGYILGPRINAGGRVGESGLGATLLATDDPGEARRISEHLDRLNQERRAIEARVLEQALVKLADLESHETETLIIAASEGWHPGVIGIVASRLKERFNRPACVVSLEGGKGTGSGRSVNGVDLGAAIIAARQAGIILGGGGHKMAAGFTVGEDRLDDLKAFLSDRMSGAVAEATRTPSLSFDGGLKVKAASLRLLQALEKVGPFGAGNAEPRFAITGALIIKADPVGADQNHLRCILTGTDGGRLSAIGFNLVETKLGQALLHHDGQPFHIAGKLRLNTWQGRSSPQLIIDDAAPVG